jgi:NhaA family Na+:H+ antiporter
MDRPQEPKPECDIRPPLEQSFSRHVQQPFSKFVSSQTTGAILLLGATLAALIIANSPWAHYYTSLESIEMGVFASDFELKKNLHDWVNDGLMVLFFFMLGLEVKREFLAGELRSIKQSSTVILAALGGMLCPALIYSIVNYGSDGAMGWGIPMATDTAFALGAMALLGSKVNPSLKVFLVALAIVDDIGAVIVIALFYTDQILWNYLAVAGACFLGLILTNRLGIRGPFFYVVLSLGLWFCIMQSGVHATMAGVLAALAIPARPKVHPGYLAKAMHSVAGRIDDRLAANQHPDKRSILGDQYKDSVLEAIQRKARLTRTPLRIWENLLDRPVSLLVIPLFAFLNAGTEISQEALASMLDASIAWGVFLGLVIGKPLGIFLFTWVTVKLGIGKLNESLTFKEIFGLALLAGMGFTMSMFIAVLSFGEGGQELLDAKLSVMFATVIAGVLGFLWLRFIAPFTPKDSASH